jgi:hypothetical protein
MKNPLMSSRILRWLLAVIIIVPIAWTSFTLWWSYSEGDRAGVLQKFSRKGWICKTYEGELALYVVSGVAPEIWSFSVRDEAVARELQSLVGERVRIRYSEHVGIPTSCFGETPYFARSVELVDAVPETMAPGAIPPMPAGEGVAPAP